MGKGFLLSLRRQRCWLGCPSPGSDTSGPPLTLVPPANSVGKNKTKQKTLKLKGTALPPPSQVALCPSLDRGSVLVLLPRELDKNHRNWRRVGGLRLPVSIPGGGDGMDKEMGE